MTYKQLILKYLRKYPEGRSCAQIVEWLKDTGNGTDKYLSGCISSILLKLRVDKIVVLSKKKAIRGGMIFKLKTIKGQF